MRAKKEEEARNAEDRKSKNRYHFTRKLCCKDALQKSPILPPGYGIVFSPSVNDNECVLSPSQCTMLLELCICLPCTATRRSRRSRIQYTWAGFTFSKMACSTRPGAVRAAQQPRDSLFYPRSTGAAAAGFSCTPFPDRLTNHTGRNHGAATPSRTVLSMQVSLLLQELCLINGFSLLL